MTDAASAAPHDPIALVTCDPSRSQVHEQGWQSWSPAGTYPADGTSPRPRKAGWQSTGYRPQRPAPERGFSGEGLLAVAPDEGPARAWFAPDPWRQVASIRAVAVDGGVEVSADGPVEEVVADSLGEVVIAAADTLAERAGVDEVPSLGPGWCSWYTYFTEVTEDDVLGDLARIDELGLDIRVVQVDDGYQAEIGDWLDRDPGFGPLDQLAGRIRDSGRTAGIWTAPFLVGARSRLATEHPDWLVGDAVPMAEGWGQPIRALDVTHPDAAEHLVGVYRQLAADGFGYHKIDFLYAGALEGRRHADCSGLDAYAEGLRLIREGIGAAATLLGCGAPLLPSIGRVDAMRIAPDIGTNLEPAEDDLSEPGQRGAVAIGAARRFLHGRWWVNDPDCILVRPEVEAREDWVEHLRADPGLMVSSDGLALLDEEGLAWTRELLRPSSPNPLPAPSG